MQISNFLRTKSSSSHDHIANAKFAIQIKPGSTGSLIYRKVELLDGLATCVAKGVLVLDGGEMVGGTFFSGRRRAVRSDESCIHLSAPLDVWDCRGARGSLPMHSTRRYGRADRGCGLASSTMARRRTG
ncbi:hypothetical protein D1007_57454 [Hordeum vulgare]|nr:hypothetical protein D1007_57454 [Hordeum vulgare]